MKPWEHPDAADQIPNPEGSDDGSASAKNLYDQGVIKAMEAVLIAIDSGASISQIREAAEQTISRLGKEDT
jgi:hypothetical protein